MLINNINNINIKNVQNKLSLKTQTKFISFAGWDSFSYEIDYINPVTNQHDNRIKRKEAELIAKGINICNYANMIAKAGIDKKTGEYSPYFNKIIRHLLPSKVDDILFKKEKKRMASSYLSHRYFQAEIPAFINSMKDKDGYFNEDNYKLAQDLVDGGYKNYQLSLSYFNSMINKIKDENGVVDNQLASYVRELSVERSVDAKAVVDIIEFLQTFSKDKQDEIFKTIIKQAPVTKKIDCEKDFIYRAKFCFDENGQKIQENCDIVDKIYKECPHIIFPDIEILNLYKNSPQIKTIIDIIMRRDDGSFPASYKKVKEYSQEENLNITNMNRMLAILPYDSELSSFNNIMQICTDPNKPDDFDDLKFKRIVDVLKISSNLPYGVGLTREETIEMFSEENSFINIPAKKKIYVYEKMKNVYNVAMTLQNKEDYTYLSEKLATIEKSFSSQNYKLKTSQENIDLAVNTILKSNAANEGLTDFELIIKKSIPKLKKYGDGLPLKYSRKEFLDDINKLVQTYPEAINILEENWGFSEYLRMPIECSSSVRTNKTYSEAEKQVDSLVHKFLYANEIQTKDPELNKQLNILIKAFPEFIGMIGRVQHGTHAYTLDIHTLLVLAEAIKNPKYQQLNARDKETVKNIALFHDISKQERIVDKKHPSESATLAKSILTKVYEDKSQISRIYELIKNHNFLEEYNNGSSTVPNEMRFAFYFRRPNDFEIAKIITEADLKSVNDTFYEQYKSRLSDKNLKGISNHIVQLQASGNAIFPSYIVDKTALNNHKQIINGREYTVINTHEFNSNEDLSKYGFAKGTYKNDLSFLVHMTNKLNSLNLLNKSESESILSESYITLSHKKTYQDKKYGVFLKHNNYDIINMAKDNQGSGKAKELGTVLGRIFHDNSGDRGYFFLTLMKNMGFFNYPLGSEYSEFYNEVLANITSLNEIDPNKTYNIGKRKFKGELLISALKETQEQILHKVLDNRINNEILTYDPEIQGIIAKEKDPNKLPKYLLDFAYENNYPILLI